MGVNTQAHRAAKNVVSRVFDLCLVLWIVLDFCPAATNALPTAVTLVQIQTFVLCV